MMKENEKRITNREVKNSAFITYFGDPENASKLYTALGDEEVGSGGYYLCDVGGSNVHRQKE